jgi:cell wall-associated NlpC family hydrolase
MVLVLVVIMAMATVVFAGWFDSAAARGPKKVLAARRLIEKRARKQIGTPYAWGGSSPGGFDCSGFTRWVFLPKATLPHNSDAQFALGGNGAYSRLWKKRKLATGDLVFFDTTSGRIGHVGIYIGAGKFIHASSSSGVRIDSVHDPYYYAPRFVAAVRAPALKVRG